MVIGARSINVSAPLCSVLCRWLGGRHYVLGAPCNQSFLVYLNASDPSGALGVLIGNSTGNWSDGFRTDALFGKELYVGPGPAKENGTLFVVDRWNCLVREVSVTVEPGDYLTRAYTVYGITSRFALLGLARCYGPGSLSNPVGLFAARGVPDTLFFLDDSGVWQLDAARRLVWPIVPLAGGSAGIAWVDAPSSAVVRVSGPAVGGIVNATAALQPCPDDSTSLEGGPCTVRCDWLDASGDPARYVDPATGACVACATPSCGYGQFLVTCTCSAQAYCQPCPPPPAGTVYARPGGCNDTYQEPAPPCEPGFYLAPAGWYCEQCPLFSETLLPGAVSVAQCKCLVGFRRVAGLCVASSLYNFSLWGLGVCAATPCSTPLHASVLDARLCAWACDPGFYFSSGTGFRDSCRPCAGMPAGAANVTRGDDDSPTSCEFLV